MNNQSQAAHDSFILIENAAAFSESAIRLCTAFADDDLHRTPSYHNVLSYLTYMSIELCFKAWLSVKGLQYERNHDLNTLHDQYCEASPPAPMQVPLAFRSRKTPTLDLFEEHPALWQDARDTHFRYATGKTGEVYPRPGLYPFRERLAEVQSVATTVTRVQLEIWRFCDFTR